MVPVLDTRRTIDAVWKLESAKIIAGLARLVRDVGLAEELAQDALVAALEQWPRTGVPDNPGAWLTTIAKRRAVDHIRRSQLLERKQELLAHELAHESAEEPDQPSDDQPDDMLRLMLISCHPVLPTASRAALTLRLLGGLTAEEIARAFLVTAPVITQRIATAKRTLSEQRIPFELPEQAELAGRISSVLEVVYLIFNEGYSATSGDDLMRPGLCHEALRLGRLLAVLAPREAEVHGLVALMEIQASRSATRTGPSGEPVLLHEQNRGRWDLLLIRRGFTAMLRARELGGPPGPYVLQAAIAVCHAQAPTSEATDWAQIAALYGALVRLLPTPVVRLNRAVAVGMARGPQAGLDLADELADDPALRDYHLLPSVRGDLLARLHRPAKARLEFQRAAALTRNTAERTFLLGRADALADAAPTGPTLGSAARAFLARTDLDPATVRSYGQTLRRLRLSLGEGLPLAELTADQVAGVFTATWGSAAPRTWNRHRAAVRSFGAWAELPDAAAGLDRRTETRTRTEPLGPDRLDALFTATRTGPSLREQTLWRLLHESGTGVKAALALNVEDLDLEDRSAGPGIAWRSGTARLLPALLAGRSRGPLFLTDRRPGPARTPTADLCPDTGRARLSYERAEYLFKQASGGLTLSRLKTRP
ncbi:RNA polymerase sigma factor [Kitasatospora sp. NPDC002040]|uniref:RNA polymerase sigma factor n=1 Tax=Kitasatospora sp. NPDC002040 TaxID=3154661 RepID=UPI00331BB028